MDKVRWLLLAVLICVGQTSLKQAQERDARPYLYYYSQMLGGIIVERADGTDSRHIGGDIIPPDMTGLGGPGWSSSGNYFAAYAVHYGPYNFSTGKPFLMNKHGAVIVDWLELIPAAHLMRWSPDARDLLLIFGGHRPALPGVGSFIWLIDVPSGKLLAELGVHLNRESPSLGNIAWDMANERVVIDIGPDLYGDFNYSRVTMHFDGTTLREPVSGEGFQSIPSDIKHDENWSTGYTRSPSQTYETFGRGFNIIKNTITGESIPLPIHTQETRCRTFVWSSDERYLISISGTLLAGGGCSQAVLGVTDNTGEFWRELSGCSWNFPPCVGWLPRHVDVHSLPPGSPSSVQLEPARIVYDEFQPGFSDLQAIPLRLLCTEYMMANIVNVETQLTVYTLAGLDCPYNADDRFAIEGLPVVIAHHATHDLLVMFQYHSWGYVSVWKRRDDDYERVLRLNTYGFALEFIEDGNYLRARNRNGWKVFEVADILAEIERTSP